MHARASVERRSRETRETRAAAREEKRETARIARPNEICVGLTTQNSSLTLELKTESGIDWKTLRPGSKVELYMWRT